MKILITSGGTDVPIDDVRKITNMSSGRYGAQIAEEFYIQDYNEHDIVYLGNRNGIFPKTEADSHYQGRKYLTSLRFSTFQEYSDISQKVAADVQPDIIILAAAVSDYILDKTEGKISSDGDELIIKLKKAHKVLPLIRAAAPDALLVGFKLLVSPTYEEKSKAIQKVFNNGADLVVYNDLTEIRKGNSTRYVYKKDMFYTEAPTAKQLIEIIKNEYSSRSNR